MTGRHETTEASMIEAHKAGMAYFNRNKSINATYENLQVLAKTCGWHGQDNEAWIAGYYGAKSRYFEDRTGARFASRSW